ncbi:hypothetical protein PG988_011329 [Apiospora saccharicola]
MRGLQICYSVGVCFQPGTPTPKLPTSPIRLPCSLSVLDDTISQDMLDINVDTNLSGVAHSLSTARQPCFHKRPEKEQSDDDDTLFGHIRGNFILTERLRPINGDTSVEDVERPGTARITTNNRRPMTLVKELHHVHFEADYEILMAREPADFDRDARELLHEMAWELGVAEGKEFSAQVESILAYLFARSTTDNEPVTEQAWLGCMYACAEKVNEARYVEAFRGALEELQERCVEYEKTREAYQETEGRRSGGPKTDLPTEPFVMQEELKKMPSLKIRYSVGIFFTAVPPCGPILLSESTALTICDPQCRFKLDLWVKTGLSTLPYAPSTIDPMCANREPEQHSQITDNVIIINFLLEERHAPADNFQIFGPGLKVARAEFDPVDFDDMLSSDRDRLAASARQMLNHHKLRLNVTEQGGFLSQVKSALVRQFEQAIPRTGDERLRNLHAFLDQLQEDQYVGVLTNALEELQDLCHGYCSSEEDE